MRRAESRNAQPIEEFFLLREKGTIRGTFARLRVETDLSERVIDVPGHTLRHQHHVGYYEIIDEFARVVRGGHEPYTNWRTGCENMLTCYGRPHPNPRKAAEGYRQRVLEIDDAGARPCASGAVVRRFSAGGFRREPSRGGHVRPRGRSVLAGSARTAPTCRSSERAGVRCRR